MNSQPPDKSFKFDDFTDAGQDYVNNNLQMAMDKLWHRARGTTPNEQISSDCISSEHLSEGTEHCEECDDWDDSTPLSLSEAINKQAHQANVYQQSSLELAYICRILVKAYILWRQEFFTPSKLPASPIRNQSMYAVAYNISESNLERDLKRVLSFLRSFKTLPWDFNEDPGRVSQAFLNALSFICCKRLFYHWSDEDTTASRTSMERSIRFDQTELHNIVSWTYQRDVYRSTQYSTDSSISQPARLTEPSHSADIAVGRSKRLMDNLEPLEQGLDHRYSQILGSLPGPPEHEEPHEGPEDQGNVLQTRGQVLGVERRKEGRGD